MADWSDDKEVARCCPLRHQKIYVSLESLCLVLQLPSKSERIIQAKKSNKDAGSKVFPTFKTLANDFLWKRHGIVNSSFHNTIRVSSSCGTKEVNSGTLFKIIWSLNRDFGSFVFESEARRFPT